MAQTDERIEALQWDLGGVGFAVNADGDLHMHYGTEEGEVFIALPGEIAFLLLTLFRMPGVRQLITREELVRQRTRHREHIKAVVASERQLAGEKYAPKKKAA